MVRAKFRVTEIVRRQMWTGQKMDEGWEVVMEVVSTGSPENEAFFRYTPNGTIRMSVLKRETADSFQPGVGYYVDFGEAPQ